MFLLSSQFYWHIRVKSTAYFLTHTVLCYITQLYALWWFIVIVALFILNQYIIGLIPYTVWRCVVYWHCPHNMRNRPGLCYRRPSICLSHSPAACCCCGFAVGPAPRRVGDIVDRSGRGAPQPAARRATAAGVCGECHVFSWIQTWLVWSWLWIGWDRDRPYL